MSRSLPVLCGLLLAASAAAQCGPYRHHPLWPDTLGSANVNLSDCPDGTSVLWDNGATTEFVNDLPVGPHTVTFFIGATPIQTIPFNIEQQHWALNQVVLGTAMGVEVDIWAEVDRCTPQILDGLDCVPDPAQTVVRLLQDGIAIDSLTPVDCIATQHWWTGLPFGHTYSTMVISTGACPSFGEGPVVTAYDCSGSTLDLQVQDDQGGGTGSIVVSSVLPGPAGPLVPTWPVTGTFRLFDADMNTIGEPQTGSTASWNGLAVGGYEVLFVCDSLCTPVLQPVQVGTTTGIAGRTSTGQALWPVPTANLLHWAGNKLCRIQVLDALGRTVLSTQGVGPLDVSSLAPGTYVLRLDNAPPRTFIKR